MGQVHGHTGYMDPSSSQAQTLCAAAASQSQVSSSMVPGHMSPRDQSISPADDTRNPFCTTQTDRQSVSPVTSLGGQPDYPVPGPMTSCTDKHMQTSLSRVGPHFWPYQ